MTGRPELDDEELRDLLSRRAIRARTDGLLASVRSSVAVTPQRRSRLPGFGFGLGRPRVAAGVAAAASLAVLVVVAALAAGGRLPDAGFVAGSSSPSTSAAAIGSAEPPATPVAPGAAEAVLPLTVDQLNAILLPNSSALLGRQLVITGTIDVNPALTLSRPVGPSPFLFSGPPAILEGAVPELGIRASTSVPLPAGLPMSGTFAAKMVDTRTLEYGGVVRLTSSGGAFLPTELPAPANTAGAALWLAQGWIAGFDVALPCPSIPGSLSGPQYNGCGVTSSLSDTGSQPVAGTTFHVPQDGVLVQDRAYDDFAPDPQLTSAGTQPELATFLVQGVFAGRCGSCLRTPADYRWAVVARIDPWPMLGLTAPPTAAPPPSPSISALQPVPPLTVAQLNAFMAMDSQSPEGRQLVITGTIAAMPRLGPNGQACDYVGGVWTCPPAYLVGSNPRLGVVPTGDIAPGPWDIGAAELTGTFAATLSGFTLSYQAAVSTNSNGVAWLPGQLPSPSQPGATAGYRLVQGWIGSLPIDPACGTGPTPYPGPQYTCGQQTTVSDSAYDAQTYVAAEDLPHTLRVQNGAYQAFAPDPTANQGGYVPELATFLLRATYVPACGPTLDCFIPPSNYHWAIVARIDPWPVPNVVPPPRGSCQDSDIQVSFDGWGPAQGSTFAQVRLALAGNPGSPCSVLAAPGVAILDANGRILASASAIASETVVLSGVLQAELGWSSWCGPLPSGPLTLRVDFGSAVVNAQLPDGFGASCAGTATKVFLNQDLHTP